MGDAFSLAVPDGWLHLAAHKQRSQAERASRQGAIAAIIMTRAMHLGQTDSATHVQSHAEGWVPVLAT